MKLNKRFEKEKDKFDDINRYLSSGVCLNWQNDIYLDTDYDYAIWFWSNYFKFDFSNMFEIETEDYTQYREENEIK